MGYAGSLRLNKVSFSGLRFCAGAGSEARAALRGEALPRALQTPTALQVRARKGSASHLESVITLHPSPGAGVFLPRGRRAGYAAAALADHLESQLSLHPCAPAGGKARVGSRGRGASPSPLTQLVQDLTIHAADPSACRPGGRHGKGRVQGQPPACHAQDLVPDLRDLSA